MRSQTLLLPREFPSRACKCKTTYLHLFSLRKLFSKVIQFIDKLLYIFIEIFNSDSLFLKLGSTNLIYACLRSIVLK